LERDPIRVLFVIGSLATGGTERQLIGILRHLDRDRFEPHLFTFYAGGDMVAEVPDDVIHHCDQTMNPAESQRRYVPGQLGRRLIGRLGEFCRSRAIDVVYDRTFHVSLVAGPAARIAGVPYINTIVANPTADFFPTAGPFAILKYFQLRRIYLRAAAVLTVSEGLRDAAARFYRIPRQRLTTCNNFLDRHRAEAIERAVAELQIERAEKPLAPVASFDASDRPLRIVVVGRLHHDKGVDVLMRAVALLVHRWNVRVHVRLVGDGPERENLQRLAKSVDVDSKIDFVGNLANPAPELVRADLFCLPSRSEGMPNSLIEALIAGTPAIATDCRFGPAEITDKGRWAALVPPGDSEALARAISDFARSPESSRQRAREAVAVIADRFSPAAGISRLEEILLRVGRQHEQKRMR
jgi:glycosyltransferase involved in cell wall biosynthesis